VDFGAVLDGRNIVAAQFQTGKRDSTLSQPLFYFSQKNIRMKARSQVSMSWKDKFLCV
jgi:hypothetical protein